MTEPKNITVSLEWAKKLKEAGWAQDEALYWWCPYMGESVYSGDATIQYQLKAENTFGDHDWCKQAGSAAAPTAEEILSRLPDSLSEIPLVLENGCDGVWIARYAGECSTVGNGGLANLLASMYCYLAENNLLPPSSHD